MNQHRVDGTLVISQQQLDSPVLMILNVCLLLNSAMDIPIVVSVMMKSSVVNVATYVFQFESIAHR